MSIREVKQGNIEESLPPAIVEIETYRKAMKNANNAFVGQDDGTLINAVGDMDGLNEVERNAALLGVSPDEWKPISFINKAHYGTLLRGNALSGSLAQKLEAFKEVSAGQD